MTVRLPNWACYIIGHKAMGLNFTQWKLVGAVAICARCGKGYAVYKKGDPWTAGILDKLEKQDDSKIE